jgi:transposase
VQQNSIPVERVVGLDAHPDSFTAALVEGPNPRAAIVRKTFDKVPMAQLTRWANKHTTPADLIVLEASGNSFHVARTLQAAGRKVQVLESAQLGKLKEAHANNDKISAVRIAKAFLAGTAKPVWVPDEKTQQRRDWYHAHRKAVRQVTRLSNSLLSYLSDNGVRTDQSAKILKQSPPKATAWLRSLKDWSATQWQVVEIQLNDLHHALDTKRRWESLLAQEVAQDPVLLSLVRLIGVREVVAFALGAVIGDIHRFAEPRKLVAYVGYNPAFDNSGNDHWSGGIGGHGHKALRSLLIESAHSLLRSKHPLGHWGRKLLARKGELKLVVAAVARKLLTSVWYLMMGRFEPVEEIPKALDLKLGVIISHIGKEGLAQLNLTRQSLRQQMHQRLKTGRIYVLDPRRRSQAGNPTQASTAELEAELDRVIPG